MNINFFKYQGTGNDFILIDNRDQVFPKQDQHLISGLCNRRFGIGADGLILLEEDRDVDFRMVYFNADGREGSMCGNGGRCMVAFADKLGLIDTQCRFSAVDGLHEAYLNGKLVSLKMNNVAQIKSKSNYLFLDTGSPHHVQLVENLDDFEVFTEGRRLRYGLYGKAGSNINFVKIQGDNLFAVRTYERGVEDETLSCGTGVTAVALAMHHLGHTSENKVKVQTRGGELEVSFQHGSEGYTDIFLKGPAAEVFKGSVLC